MSDIINWIACYPCLKVLSRVHPDTKHNFIPPQTQPGCSREVEDVIILDNEKSLTKTLFVATTVQSPQRTKCIYFILLLQVKFN